MHFLITGGTGLIGSALSENLLQENIEITVLTRNPEEAIKNGSKDINYISSLSDFKGDKAIDVIVNLAGEPISKRWTEDIKRELLESRIRVTKDLVAYINVAKQKPKILISGSAIGYYGADEHTDFTEESNPQDCFTSNLCQQWEAEALKVQEHCPVSLLRTGVVLSGQCGALPKLLTGFKLGLGGALGSGDQWMSWIHIDDMVSIIKFIVDNELKGPFNLTSPNPVTNKYFTHALGRALHRPTLLNIPAFMVKLLFGEMGEELLLKGQKVLPQKLEKNGYKFLYPKIEEAFASLVNK